MADSPSLNILKYPWHTGHDYELLKLPHTFFLLDSTYRSWAKQYRPFPRNVITVPGVTECPTDVMILHLDQWSWHEPAKRYLFLHLKNQYKGRKIVILHGCNLQDGCSRKQMLRLTEGCHIVCNSETSHRHWNLPNSRFILHGFDPDEWPQTNYEHNRIIMVQPFRSRWAKTSNLAGIERAERYFPLYWIGRDINPKSFAEYTSVLANSSIFFQPSYASTNPRSRAEAMLMGLAVVTTASHGEDNYIENGVNGYASNDFDELMGALEKLRKDKKHAKEIGLAGRETARAVFSWDKYEEAWSALLYEVMQGQHNE